MAERRAQASVKSKKRLAAKKISVPERKKGESGRSSAPALDRRFGNLLPNATKPKAEASVSC
jgi:hypothetical protein